MLQLVVAWDASIKLQFKYLFNLHHIFVDLCSAGISHASVYMDISKELDLYVSVMLTFS